MGYGTKLVYNTGGKFKQMGVVSVGVVSEFDTTKCKGGPVRIIA